MKLLIQRVLHAEVVVDGNAVGSINRGILALIGIEKDDEPSHLQRMADKLCHYRIFPDSDDKMNLNVQDVQGGILAVSQFTLAANTKKGMRPSFSSACPPHEAEALYLHFVEMLREYKVKIETGIFGADMQVRLVNDGPVTFLLES